MRIPILLGALGAGLALCVAVGLATGLGPCGRTVPAIVESAGAAATLTADPALALDEGQPSAQRTPAQAAPVPPAETHASPASVRDGREVRLTLLERHSQRPLPGFGVRLRQGELELLVRTDDAGAATARAPWKPGAISMWHEPDPEQVAYEADWLLEPWQVDMPPGSGARTSVVLAERPALVLVVETVGTDGALLEGAEIALVWGWRDNAGRMHADSVLHARSDAGGRARLSVTPEQARSARALLSAVERERGLASAQMPLDAPHARGPWRLVLEPAGSVRVEAFDAQGAPLGTGFANVVSAESVNAAMSASGGRIEAGVCVLGGLGPGRWRVSVRDGALEDERTLEVEVAAGAQARVEARFDDGATALAAAGRVLDADDRPLAGVTVWMDVRGRPPTFCITGKDGAFGFRAAPADELVIGTARDVHGDLFEPAELRVAFGAPDLLLRRARELPQRRIDFQVLDGETGRPPVDGGGVFVLLDQPRAAGGWSWEALTEGRAGVWTKAHEGLRWRAHCPGYLPVEGPVPPATAAGQPVVVMLARGFEQRLHVCDADGEPLAGAEVLDPAGGCAASADARGDVLLRASSWPAKLRVRREGFLERLLDPGELELVSGVVALQPLEGR